MRRLLGIFCAVWFLSGTARAEIGDTEVQIQTRYGAPVTILPSNPDDAGLTKCYTSAGYSIAVTFLHGRSSRETLIKADKSKISEKEVRALLKARGGAESWNLQRELSSPIDAGASVLEWHGTDHRIALYDSHSQALFITTQKYINLTNEKSRRRVMRSELKILPRWRAQTAEALQKGAAIRTQGGRGQAQPSDTPASPAR